jgi:Flp pilus assembly protein TadG
MRSQVHLASSARDEVQHAWAPRTDAAPTRLRRRAPRLRSESGQSAVEFALIVPFILFLILAIVDFGKGVNYWLDANHLANQGARLAAVLGNQTPPGGGTMQAWIQQQAETSELRNGTGSVTSPARVCVTFPNGGTPKIGDPVTVTVTAPYKWISFVSASTFDISGSATMRLEQLPQSYSAGCSS